MLRTAINIGARIVNCGTASIGNWDPWPQGPRVERHLLVKRARMQGFLVSDHAARNDEALRELTRWIREGRIRYREDVLEGIERRVERTTDADGVATVLGGGASDALERP